MTPIARTSIVAVASVLASLLGPILRAGEALPSLDAPDLPRGPYAAAHMLLEKTFLRINVAEVDVRFGKSAQARFTDIVRGQQFSSAIEALMAPVAIDADRAVVQMRFLRDVPLTRWIGVVRENLEQARSAGLIPRELEEQVSQSLPLRFSALETRGYAKGDRVVYSVMPDELRTVVISGSGAVLVDFEERGQRARRVVLASYFAPKSDFRVPLLESLVARGR